MGVVTVDGTTASDFSDKAVQVARERLRGQAHVRVEQQALPGGWKPGFAERRLPTAAVHAALNALGLPLRVHHEEDDFVLNVGSADARSVAQREGIR